MYDYFKPTSKNGIMLRILVPPKACGYLWGICRRCRDMRGAGPTGPACAIYISQYSSPNQNDTMHISPSFR